MEDSLNSQGIPLIPPAYNRDSRDSAETDAEPRSDLPFLLPLSHAHPLLSSFNPDWDVDAFLLSRLHTPLDELRTDLRSYLVVLKQELVQLINEDYTEFISLGTGLKGEGERLNRVKAPLVELKKDVANIRDSLIADEASVQAKLEERASLRDEKTLLQLLLNLTDSLTRTETLLDISSSTVSSSTTPRTTRFAGAASSGGKGEKLVARVAAEYTRVLYLVEKAKADECALVAEVEWRIERIRNTLNRDLDHLFSETLASLSAPSTNQEESAETLLECLKTYQLVEGWRDAEDLFRREVVRPFIRKIVSEDALHNPSSPLVPKTPYVSSIHPFAALKGNVSSFPLTPVTPQSAAPTVNAEQDENLNPFDLIDPILGATLQRGTPLASILNELLKGVKNECKTVLDIAERLRAPGEAESTDPASTADRPGFELFGNVVWKEIGERLIDELGSTIFAIGQPDELHQNYILLHAFFSQLETLSPSLASIYAMRNHPTYKAFEKRWQLPVYFQLRWKEIVTELEESLAAAEREKERGITAQERDGFFLSQTVATLRAMRACWAPGIIIPELSHRFWRLNLQILSRYRTWLQTVAPSTEHLTTAAERVAAVDQVTNKGSASTSGRATPNPDVLGTVDPTQTAEEDERLRHATLVIADLRRLDRQVHALYENEIAAFITSSDPTVLSGLNDDEELDPLVILENSLATLSALIPLLSSQILAILVKRCTDTLRLVRSVVSQYRGLANKRAPTAASYFVPSILKPVRDFLGASGVGRHVKSELGAEWSADVFEEVALSYTSALVSVRKNEESLRKLRKSRKSTFSLFGGGGSAGAGSTAEEQRDELNIQAQMVLDIEALRKDAQELGVNVDASKAFKELQAVAKGQDAVSA